MGCSTSLQLNQSELQGNRQSPDASSQQPEARIHPCSLDRLTRVSKGLARRVGTLPIVALWPWTSCLTPLISAPHHGKPEEALSMARVLQQELASRLALLALHTNRHPEQMPRFAELAADLLSDLCCWEHDIYPSEGLIALSQCGMAPHCAGDGSGCEPGLN